MILVDNAWILSVGIDVGTSTTKLIVSRLRIDQVSGPGAIPKHEIVGRELLYVGPLHGTPLLSEEEIDGSALSEIIREEYVKAGIRAADIQTGAVIVTGETATKGNASTIVRLLAEQAGDFVVATAGAELEGILAGKGAGADGRSRVLKGVVANIDVGGGTANVAFFRNGQWIDTVTFHVGGRVIRMNERGKVLKVSPHIVPWLTVNGFLITPGQILKYGQWEEICNRMSRDMLRYLAGQEASLTWHQLLLGPALANRYPVEEWTFSGGVGELMGKPLPESLDGSSAYGDIGPILARSLARASESLGLNLGLPDQTTRATVIGAGTQSIELSGATVFVEESMLPIRNLPVLKLDLAESGSSSFMGMKEAAAKLIRQGNIWYGQSNPDEATFAIAIGSVGYYSYRSIQDLAKSLLEAYREEEPDNHKMVLICEQDMAKALGQSIYRQSGYEMRIVCLDEIRARQGDYIDIGQAPSGTWIPVTVKTLAFHSAAQ